MSIFFLLFLLIILYILFKLYLACFNRFNIFELLNHMFLNNRQRFAICRRFLVTYFTKIKYFMLAHNRYIIATYENQSTLLFGTIRFLFFVFFLAYIFSIMAVDIRTIPSRFHLVCHKIHF